MTRLVALLPLLMVAACDLAGEPEGQPVTRIEIGKGEVVALTPSPTPTAEVASACESVLFEEVPLTHCVADPAKHRITTALAPEGGAPFRSLKAYSTSVDGKGVAFAMNAGMFDGEGKPIGYYVEEGNRLKELNRNDGSGNFHMKPNGVFFGGGGKWRVMTADAFYSQVGDRPEFGTQSGPMLLVGGKLHPEVTEDGPSKRIRNAVGVDAQGRAHFVISDGALSFGVLARYFRDELKVKDALYLDGSVSALWDPAKGRMDARAPIGPLLVVTDRE